MGQRPGEANRKSIGVGDGSGVAALGGRVATMTATAQTTASIAEETLFSYTLPANSLNENGKVLRIKVWGFFGANANAKTVRIYEAASSDTVNSVTASPNGLSFVSEVTLIRRTATNLSRAHSHTVGSVAQNCGAGQNLAFDTTVDQIIKVTGQNGVASAGDIQVYGVIVEVL